MAIGRISAEQLSLLVDSIILATREKRTEWLFYESEIMYVCNLFDNEILIKIKESTNADRDWPFAITTVTLRTNEDTAMRLFAYKMLEANFIEAEFKLSKLMYLIYKSSRNLTHIKDIVFEDKLERSIRQELNIFDVIDIRTLEDKTYSTTE